MYVDEPDVPLATLYDVAERSILVTGAGKGIGRWIAKGLGEVGAHVTAVSRTSSECEAVVEEIEAAGGRATAFTADIQDPQQCEAMVGAAVEEFGRIDAVINNAGATSHRIPAMEVDEAEFDRTVDTNVKGTYFACQAAAARMIEQGSEGRIVNFASTAALLIRMGVPNSAYAASKAAVTQMTKSFAAEFAPYGITVNCIAPGRFFVERNAQYNSPGSDEYERVRPTIPLGRAGGRNDMIGPALFFASDASRYVTGQTLYVDGGRTVL